MQAPRRTALVLILSVLLWTSVVAVPISAAPGTSDVGVDAAAVGSADAAADAAAVGSADAAPNIHIDARDDLGNPNRVADASGDGWAVSPGREDGESRRGGGTIKKDGDRYERLDTDDRKQIGTDDYRASAASDTIRLTNELQQIDDVGEYGVESRISLPDKVTEVEVTLPSNAIDVKGHGFDRAGDETWEWDGTTENPRLTYRMPANRTADDEGPLEGKGNLLFADAGEWAIVQPPSPGVRWSWTGGGQVRLDRENTARDGAASEAMVYLGPSEQYTREANGQRFRLVVPAAADLEESPEAILDELAYASGAMQVGARSSEVFVIAAPTGDVQWAVRGLQTGPADVWVRDVERLDDADNVWVHEYIHTRQRYRTDASARWFTEASVTYYAALLTLERGGTSFSEFRSVLRYGERDPQASSVLAELSTWRNHADYTKGALVAGEIDRRIRIATDGEKSLATVFREMNAKDGRVTGDDVLRFVGEAGGADVRDEAERLTTTQAEATTWNRATHDEAFGTLPARIGYSIPDNADDTVRVTGEFRDRTIPTDDRDPITLVAGETLQLPIAATNTGGTAGEYDLTFVVDGESRENRSGRLAGGESTVERFDHGFVEPGKHEIRVGGETITVVVVEPASLSVIDLEADSDEVAIDRPVNVTVTVRNAEPIPGRETIDIAVDGESVASETVALNAESTGELRVSVRFDDPGESVVSAGDRRITVQVIDDAEGGTSNDGESGDGPSIDDVDGFGYGVTVVAVLVASLLFRRRH